MDSQVYEVSICECGYVYSAGNGECDNYPAQERKLIDLDLYVKAREALERIAHWPESDLSRYTILAARDALRELPNPETETP